MEYDTTKIKDIYKYNYSICPIDAYFDAINSGKQNTAILIVYQINKSGNYKTSKSYTATTVHVSEVALEFRIYDVATGELLGTVDSKGGDKVKKSIYKYTGTMTITDRFFTEPNKQIEHIETNYLKL